MPLPCILRGFETPQKHFFFRFFVPRNKRRTGKNRDKLPKFGIIDYRWSISYQSPLIADISAEISEILFLGHWKLLLCCNIGSIDKELYDLFNY